MRPLTRLAATCATTAALLLTGTATASATATHPTTASTPTAPDHTPLTSLYRGVQGANLCLLAHCTTGTNDPARVTNTQGANLCLLAVCSIRP
ncbi:hypothetical protein ACWHAN_28190 [Streptomyces albidoflavus]|uniref:hypothetical protein n=1 Tax=Streptomyces TaxID=1883 RepID=UPI0004CD7B6C|nr:MULTISPECIES: hypothetical protein [unclassified Streptomyces]MBK3382312.1 hypothetical protein [Streptomyces sp. DEF147AK]MBK3388241.1 hypothetical protein [Streptomyces sp. DEF1AK]